MRGHSRARGGNSFYTVAVALALRKHSAILARGRDRPAQSPLDFTVPAHLDLPGHVRLYLNFEIMRIGWSGVRAYSFATPGRLLATLVNHAVLHHKIDVLQNADIR
jgi:hypothetical protein